MNFIILIALVLVIAVVVLFVRIVIVQEASAVAFKCLARFAYCAMEFTVTIILSQMVLSSGQGENYYGSCWLILRIGGWVFYLWPFVEPAKYSDYNDPDGFGEGIYIHRLI